MNIFEVPSFESIKGKSIPTDEAGQSRERSLIVEEAKQRKKEEFENLQKKYEEAEKKLFGIGKFFGRKKREIEIENILSEIKYLEISDKEYLNLAIQKIEEIQEDANRRELLLRNGSITKEEAQTAPDDLIWNKLLELAERVERDAEEGQEINRGIKEGILSISEAQVPQAKEILDQRKEEILSHYYNEERGWDQEIKEKLNWNHLAFVRRTNILPTFDPESGRVYVHRPITDIEDPHNPAFLRPTTHWGLQTPTPNPGKGEGQYGTDYVIFTDGKKMVEENGKPHNLFPEDTYWTHDLVLPQGSVIFTKDIIDNQLINIYRKGRIEVVKIQEGEDLNKAVEEFSVKKGYNPRISSYIEKLANENGLRYGLHEGDESNVAVKKIDNILGILQVIEKDKFSDDDRYIIGTLYYRSLDRDKKLKDRDWKSVDKEKKDFSKKEISELKPWLKKELMVWYQDLLIAIKTQYNSTSQEQLKKVESLLEPIIEKL